MPWTDEIQPLHADQPLSASKFGMRAARLSTIAAKGVPVPQGMALSIDLVRDIAKHGIDALPQELSSALDGVPMNTALVVRASPENPNWGGPATVLNVGQELDGEELSMSDALVSMVDIWMRPSSRILRTARGAPENAGLGLIIQEMVIAEEESRTIQKIDPTSGLAKTDSVEAEVDGFIAHAVDILEDAAAVRVVSTPKGLQLLDFMAANRKPRAEIQIVVDLVEQNVLTREKALLRIEPRILTEHLHPQIKSVENVDVICVGIGASAGAAQGGIVFTAEAAQAAHAQEKQVILVREETMPEDIRGMHSAAGVLTSTGGTSSHAAVIAQGIGVPCVVGASDLKIDFLAKKLTLADGTVLAENDQITINGSNGQVLKGALDLSHSALSDAFMTLMTWADEIRDIGVRANADTKQEAETAKRFLVDGIGLCRTEHMFYDGDRINVMRQMILANDKESRLSALTELLPMQRENFVELFTLMEGDPVTIRLLDPPLHEFLPKANEDVSGLAEIMKLSVETLQSRIAGMQEFNPMLGKRGVRLAVTMPEIYEMQARAIFEAAQITEAKIGKPIVPEIMIPLVSAHREVELVKERIESVAQLVQMESGDRPKFHIGVMVETPRAALRAGDLAGATSFLSFGTNDLTQMTYGLSRDDAGRFMREYVNEKVFSEDPFLTLDVEGVGELLLMAAQRGRMANKDIQLGLCGEHGGDPASVHFCKIAGFDYVSCSPYRVPIARLAAAQASLLVRNSD